MKPQPLKPGDVVIELAGLAKTCGLVSGGISAATAAGIAWHSFLYAGIAFVAGCVVGYFLGIPIGDWQFHSPQGKLVVVKKGKESLPKTLRASLPSSLASALLCSLAVGMTVSSANLGMILIVALVIAIVMGTILAVLSSLA